MVTAIKRPVPHRVKPPFVIFDIHDPGTPTLSHVRELFRKTRRISNLMGLDNIEEFL